MAARVRLHGHLVACKGRHQHEEGGAGEVEVGDEAVHRLEAVGRVDEEMGLPGPGPDPAVLPGGALQGPDHRGPHRPDPCPRWPCIGSPPPPPPGGNLVGLRVHAVVGRILRLHGPEGPDPTWRVTRASPTPRRAQLVQEFRGEVEARRGGRHGPGMGRRPSGSAPGPGARPPAPGRGGGACGRTGRGGGRHASPWKRDDCSGRASGGV
jgi:hypothetical protein